MANVQGDFEEFIRFYQEGLIVHGSYWDHIKSSWAYKDHPNFLIIWFEEMKKNQRLVIDNVCKFVNCDLSEEKKTQLVEHLKFDNMKRNKSVNLEDVVLRGSFIRKGEVGDWKNHFDDHTKKKMDSWVKDNLENTTIPVQYYT